MDPVRSFDNTFIGLAFKLEVRINISKFLAH